MTANTSSKPRPAPKPKPTPKPRGIVHQGVQPVDKSPWRK